MSQGNAAGYEFRGWHPGLPGSAIGSARNPPRKRRHPDLTQGRLYPDMPAAVFFDFRLLAHSCRNLSVASWQSIGSVPELPRNLWN